MANEQRDGKRERSTRQDAEGDTFKREGPTPPANTTGNSIEEMNQAAEDSLVRNIRPDETTD